MQVQPLDHDFWRADCRGPGLNHTHTGCDGTTDHGDCACKDCGLTPNRWAAHVNFVANEAGAPLEDEEPLQLPQPGELGVPIMEQRYTSVGRVDRYVEWVSGLISYAHPDRVPFIGHYVAGDPNGPGRGELSPAWKEWALKAEWLS